MILSKSNNSTSPNSRLLTRRKLAVISVISVTFLFLLLFNIGSYLFINKIGGYLEQGLDARLKTTANMASGLLERGLNNIYDPTEQSYLRLRLERTRTQNDLEAAYIINANIEVIVDSRPELENVSRSYLREDSLALRMIETGQTATSELHTVAGNHFKNVYVPIYDLYGNTAIIVLEASAEYFNIISFFRRGLYLGSIISLLLLILLVFFLTWATRMLLKTETELQKSQRLAVMGQMAATVAHEIRNPLGIIKSTSDVLREKYQDTTQPDEMFGFINEEINRLNRLVNDFLSFSREPKLNISKNDLYQLARQAIHSYPEEEFGKTDIIFDPGQNELVVNCDRDMVHRVILNLLINARQAVRAGDAIITVDISRELKKGKNIAIVKISDNGTGINGDPEEIFNPFFTTKTKGTGLGLAVSRNIIEKHGGKMSAGNNTGPGATIQFTIPVE